MNKIICLCLMYYSACASIPAIKPSQSSSTTKNFGYSLTIYNQNTMHNTPLTTHHIHPAPALEVSSWYTPKTFITYGCAMSAACYIIYWTSSHLATSLLDSDQRWWNWHVEIPVAKLALIEFKTISDELTITAAEKYTGIDSSFSQIIQEIKDEEHTLEELLWWCASLQNLPIPYVRAKASTIIQQIHDKKNRLLIIKRSIESVHILQSDTSTL